VGRQCDVNYLTNQKDQLDLANSEKSFFVLMVNKLITDHPNYALFGTREQDEMKKI
jgi:hypothetical protein